MADTDKLYEILNYYGLKTNIEETKKWVKKYVDEAISQIPPSQTLEAGTNITILDDIISSDQISNVEELPDASENRDRIFRRNGDKDVFISKRIYSTVLPPTNKLPDNEQIDKAYLLDGGGVSYYKGPYTITCADGVLNWYLWDGSRIGKWVTSENGLNSTEMTPVIMVDSEGGDWSDITETGATTTMTMHEVEEDDTISGNGLKLVQAIYNVSETNQIGNAKLIDHDWGSNEQIYSGEEVTVQYDGDTYHGYKWLLGNNPNVYWFTNKKASEIYYYDDNGNTYSDTGLYLYNDGDVVDRDYDVVYIPTLNAQDEEQLSVAYLENQTRWHGNYKYIYKGQIEIGCSIDWEKEEPTEYLTAYLWEREGGDAEQSWNDAYITIKNANSQYGQLIKGVFPNEDLQYNPNYSGWFSPTYDAASLSIVIANGSDDVQSQTSNLVKYQQVYTVEEWDWVSQLTQTYTKEEIDNLLDGKADTEHTHQISDVSGLTEALENKADVEHTHQISDVSALTETISDINTEIAKKQDTLIPSTGISIDSENRISCTIDIRDLINDRISSTETTYSSEKIMALIDGISEFFIEIVQKLPDTGDTHTIYFVPAQESGSTDNYYEEYMYIEDNWELIGTTRIDLSNYYTIDEVDYLLEQKSNVDHTHQMSEVSGLTGTIDKIENELSEHQGTISGIVEDIADMAATLLDHENRIEELSARTYSAGSHILIDSANTISALYQSSDFDISGLTDSQNLRETWSGKQDALSAGTGIIIDANNVISVNEEEIAEIDDEVTETGKTWSSYKINSELDTKSNTDHTHTISDVTDLQNLLDGKSDTGHTHEQYSLTSHTHTISDISGLTEELNNKSNTGHTHDDYVLKSVFESSTYAFSSHINELTERVDADDAIQNITVEDVIDELNIIDNN